MNYSTTTVAEFAETQPATPSRFGSPAEFLRIQLPVDCLATLALFVVLPPIGLIGSGTCPAGEAPKDVEVLWADYDPQRDPLEAEVVREWKKDGIVFRYVLYDIRTFKDAKARMAAFYGLPEGGTRLPGLLHLHGGGQRAFLHEVEYYAKRGYACLSINWGGRPMEDAEPSEPNTDWGAVDPTQQNVPGYFNLQPGEKYLDDFESPRNNNWYLLTIGARRGLTFLEQQPEVDSERLGVYGHSMGGNLTMYVAGCDDRVKVAAPSVGGSGFRTYPWPLLPEQKKHLPRGDVELFRATIGFQSYAARVKAPLLFLGATNDFHGIMDDTFGTGALIPHDQVRYAFAPHLNHRFTPEFAITRPLWIDQHLKGTFSFPHAPQSRLALNEEDAIPTLRVMPDVSKSIEKVHVYYSIDPDPQARFWRSTDTKRGAENTWTGKLPIMSTEHPLFAFANVHYRLDSAEQPPFARPVETFAISSLLHTATPAELDDAGIRATDQPSLTIDDFANGFRDWYRLSADNPHHWQYWTRKINDPKWRGQDHYRLALDVKTSDANPIVIVLTENFFRPYRGKQQDYVHTVELQGDNQWQIVKLAPSDFQTPDGQRQLRSWKTVDLLGFRAYYQANREDEEAALGTKRWRGPRPVFRSLRWVLQPSLRASE